MFAKKSPQVVDAVHAYSNIAGEFSRIANGRRAYLEQVENWIIGRIPKGACSMLDVGSGDGHRAKRIATSCGIERLVLLEPSAPMRELAVGEAEIWDLRAEELGAVSERFDVITCLWNVLGHVESNARRLQVLSHFSRLLRTGGMLFIDFNHRYNASEYGLGPTLLRLLRDKVRPDERNGDVVAQWPVGGETWATKGHVFTGKEVRDLMSAAGLKVRQRVVIGYGSGQIRRWPFQGNLLYAAGTEDSAFPSARQTSSTSGEES